MGYNSPFNSRYGSECMRTIFSDEHRHSMWRILWYKLACAERNLGLPITLEQTCEMADHIEDIDYKRVSQYESETHHDVMAHILAFGDACPKARPIIHLGATSCFVTDNTDVLLQCDALSQIAMKMNTVTDLLCIFATAHADTPTTGYTHLQVAQPTTVGKRASMWLQDLKMDYEQMTFQKRRIKLLGCRGATGTAASFVELFNGDTSKVERLEELVFSDCNYEIFKVSGQTYTRKQDYDIANVLCGIAQSASKFANDIRFLSSVGEVYEKRKAGQVGSSAMPYKVNPIQSEKINSLSRFVIGGMQTFAMNTATQFMERTLDDSANRRILIPEMFLATEEILDTYKSVLDDLFVDVDAINEHMQESLPMILEEPVMMRAVLGGEDRQNVHEALRNARGVDLEDDAMVDRLTGMAKMQVRDLIHG